ncbi:MAG TPA: VWA domain-containing protein [Planctomycetota bacterium]|nr:VWA domain-containing protein [Planctomycetota bacterium]
MSAFFAGIGGWLNAHFLGLTAAALGLAAAVPLVVALYFLKLKRREQVVSSTLLWRRALDDLRVNAPFQRLRASLLLVLQLLVLLALGLALARPFAPGAASGRQNHFVLVIDRSASMTTADCGGRSRLEAAKETALELVRRMPGESRAAVIAFASSPQVLTGFTLAKSELEEAIRGIEAGGSGTDMEGALQVADGLAGPVGRDSCRLIVMSDLAVPANRPVRPVTSELELRRFGKEAANLAVTALEARRLPGAPTQVFARIANFGREKAGVKARLFFGDRREPADARDLVLAAGARETVVFEAMAPTGLTPARVQVVPASGAPDAMTIDDEAWTVLPLERDLRLLVYTDDRNFLVKALTGLPGTRCERLDASAVPAKGEAPPAAWADRDLVVFDSCAPGSLPASGGYLFINSCPPLESAALGEAVRAPKSVDWDRSHQLTRFASLEGIGVVRARAVKLGPGQINLLESEAGPLVAAWRHEQLRVLVVGFDLYESNWPLRVSFPIFMANAARWLAEAGPSSVLWSAGAGRCGQPLRLTASAWADPTAPAGGAAVEIRPPGGGTPERLEVPAGSPRLYSATEQPGIYRAVGPKDREVLFACSVLDEIESDNSARETLNFAVKDAPGWSREQASAAGGEASAGREYWKYAAVLALAVFMLEWFIYNRRLWG